MGWDRDGLRELDMVGWLVLLDYAAAWGSCETEMEWC
jgi:hypothetical protein